MAIKWKIDPAMLKFWNKKGSKIRIWRKRHGLKDAKPDQKNSADASLNATPGMVVNSKSE